MVKGVVIEVDYKAMNCSVMWTDNTGEERIMDKVALAVKSNLGDLVALRLVKNRYVAY